jgi:melibiose permease
MKIDFKTKISYAVGGFGKDMMFAMSTVMLFYFDQWLGISAAFVGVMMMIVRAWDAVNDPIMGSIVDRTKTRWGKFRPWILLGTVSNAIITVILFSNPDLATNGFSHLFFITAFYTLWGMTYTLMDIPFWSMIPTLSDSQKEREDVTVLTRLFTSIGYFIIAGGYVTLANVLGSNNPVKGMFVLSVIVGVVFIICELIAVTNVKEKIVVEAQEKSTLKTMWRLLKENDQLLVVMMVVLIINFTLYITSGMAIYYITYNIGNPDMYFIFIAAGGVLQLVGSLIYPILSKKFKRKQIYNIAIIVQFIGFVLLFVNAFIIGDSIPLLFVFAGLVFLGQGIFMVLQTVLLSDTVEYGELKTGRRSESVAFSVQTFIVKLAMGLSLGFIGLGLGIIKIVDPIKDQFDNIIYQPQSDSTLLGISIIMFILPLFGLLIGRYLFNKKHILDEEKYAGVLEELEAIRGSGVHE